MSTLKRKIAVLATVFSLALFAVAYGFALPSGALASTAATASAAVSTAGAASGKTTR